MKKNEIKAGKTNVPEGTTREQEDRAFNRMLLWLAAAVLVEVVMLLVNRYYVHARIAELEFMQVLHTLLGFAPVLGIVLFVVCLLWGFHVRKQGEAQWDGVLQIVLGSALLAIGLGGYVMRLFGTNGASLVLGVVPALGVLALVFYLYQKEFFACAIAGGLGILGLWVFRVSGSGAKYYLFLVVVLVILAAGVALAIALKKRDGVLTIRGKDVAVLQPGGAYPAYYITAAVVVVLLLAPLVIGASVAYYAIWVMAAWLFILAVYFTSKLM